jgi:redox-sensitive bicupin YhaK (pirin superfamily)
MMLTIRRSEDRGRFDMGWLDTRHTFSFGEYYDPRYLGFSALRVINEDRVAPGKGFPTHGHRDMEIVTYILRGALEHKDSLGTGSVIRPGDVQRMSAGAGIQHSEFNHSAEEPVHFLQIWILPDQKGMPPSYEQITVPVQDRHDRLRLIGSRDGRDGSVTIHQNLGLYSALLSPGAKLDHAFEADRAGWIQVASGAIEVNGLHLRAGDGVAAIKETALKIAALEPAEILLFDLPGQ